MNWTELLQTITCSDAFQTERAKYHKLASEIDSLRSTYSRSHREGLLDLIDEAEKELYSIEEQLKTIIQSVLVDEVFNEFVLLPNVVKVVTVNR
jgi:hypothetical protein